jgi:hypothetical protein
MKEYCLFYEDAYDYVKRCREIIQPNDGFTRQLESFQMQTECKIFYRLIDNETTVAPKQELHQR